MSVGLVYVPHDHLLACVVCGVEPSLTGDARCGCSLADVLAATSVPEDCGSPACTECGRPGVVFRRVNSGEKPKCRTCAGLRTEVKRTR